MTYIVYLVPEDIEYTKLQQIKQNISSTDDDTASVLMTLTRQPLCTKSFNTSRSSWKPHELFALPNLQSNVQKQTQTKSNLGKDEL